MKSHTEIFLFTTLASYLLHLMIKKDLKVDSVNPLYLILNKMNGN